MGIEYITDMGPVRPGNSAAPNNWDVATNGVLGDQSDSTYGAVSTNADGDYTQGWELGAFPADLYRVSHIGFTIRYGWVTAPANTAWELSTGGGTGAITAYVTDSGGTIQLGGASATLADGHEMLAAHPTDADTTIREVTVGFSYTNATATLAQWNGAILVLTIGRNRSKGGDTDEQAIYQVETIPTSRWETYTYPPHPLRRQPTIRM